MGKEIAAIALLAALIALAVVNVYFVDRMADELTEMVETASSAEDAERALNRWDEVKWYTGIILRHSELDHLSDDYYSLIGAFKAGTDASTAKQRLKWRLTCIRDMEKLSLGSIF
jgi:hypothetical protein